MLWVTSGEGWGSWGSCGPDTSQGGPGDEGETLQVNVPLDKPSGLFKPGALEIGSGTENFRHLGGKNKQMLKTERKFGEFLEKDSSTEFRQALFPSIGGRGKLWPGN